MSDPFVGEIRMFGGNFAPMGWAFCDGSLLAIIENETLFNLIGTTYGGDGQTTFALPDLRGRVPVHRGQGPGLSPRIQGEKGGTENVTLTAPQMPSHSHVLRASTAAATLGAPGGAVLAKAPVNVYGTAAATQPMAASGLTPSPGGSQPHSNMAPYLAISYIISLFGIFPSPN
jgi:microcystin-dependent protein